MPYRDPGFAVANTIEDILTKRELLKRQAAQDVLNTRNVESQIADRESNRRIQEETAKALAEERQSNAQIKRAAFFTPGQEIGYAPDPNLLPAGTVKPAAFPYSQVGITPPQSEAATTGAADLQGPPVGDVHPASYTGTAQDRQESEDQKAALEYLQGLDPKKPIDPKQFLIAQVKSHNKINMPAGGFAQAKDVHSPPYTEYLDYVASLPPGTKPKLFEQWKIDNANYKRPTPSTTEHAAVIGEMDDPEHPGQKIPAWLDPYHTEAPPVPVKGGGRKTPPAGAAAKSMTTADVNAIKAAWAAAGKGKTGFWGNTPNPEAQKGLVAVQNRFIGFLPEPWMQEDATAIMKDPNAQKHSIEDIVAAEQGPNGEDLTPEQDAAFRRVLTYVLGKF